MPTSGRHGKVLARAVLVAAVVAAAPADVRTQDRMSFAARDAARAARVRETQRLEFERARAHARMPSTMYASTPDRTPPHPILLAPPAAEPTERPRALPPPPRAAGTPVARAYRVPLLPAAERWAEGGYEGVVRIVNRGDVAGEVRIDAVDDSGTHWGTLALDIGAGASVQLTSADLERGNPATGLDGAAGDGEGDWRLEITSGLDVEVRAYIRTADGFLTPVHDRVTPDARGHRVALFNPGRDVAQASRLRLVNPGAQPAEVLIEAIDDTGVAAPGTVRLELPAGAARTLSAHELESGAPGLAGALGSGQGKWRLLVTSPQPLEVMNLVSSPTGHLVNLSSSPASRALDGGTFVHDVPLLPSPRCAGCETACRGSCALSTTLPERAPCTSTPSTTTGPAPVRSPSPSARTRPCTSAPTTSSKATRAKGFPRASAPAPGTGGFACARPWSSRSWPTSRATTGSSRACTSAPRSPSRGTASRCSTPERAPGTRAAFGSSTPSTGPPG